MAIKRTITVSPVLGEISERMAPSVITNGDLVYGLREATNVLISPNREVTSRPPMIDIDPSPAPTATAIARSFQFRLPNGKFTILTFTDLALNQTIVDDEDTFTTITTTWTEADIEAMDASQHELVMIFVTAAKEPQTIIYADPNFTWATLESVKTSTNATPWYVATDWPISVSFMIGRFIMVSARKYYGSAIVEGTVKGLEWDLVERTVDAQQVLTSASGFSFDAADDLDSGFMKIKGGTLAFAISPAGVWMMSNYTDGLNATNPNIKNYNTDGAYNIKPEDVNGLMAYFASDKKTLRLFGVTPEGPINKAVNLYSRHLFETSPPVKMVYQRTPDTILWILRADGALIAFCVDEVRQAWSKMETDGTVLDIWLGKDNDQEYLYLETLRGDPEAYWDRRIERLETVDPLYAPYHGDSLTVMEYGSNCLCTVEADDGGDAVFSFLGTLTFGDGDLVTFGDLEGYSSGTAIEITATTFKFRLPDVSLIPYGQGTGFYARNAVTEITIDRFGGKNVDIFHDGENLTTITAEADGLITLEEPASVVMASLPYYSIMQPPSYTNHTYYERASVNKIMPRVYKTNMLLYGHSEIEPADLASKHLDSDGYTGVVPNLPIKSGMDYECSFRIGSKGTPFILVSVFAEIEVGEN